MWSGAAGGLLGACCLLVMSGAGLAQSTLLNVSYDVTRELYKDINPAFVADWKARHGEAVTVNQSHGGSSKQALAVASGLEADVVTMNQPPDIDILVEKDGLVATDWRARFPHDATPYTTITVFMVRRGNPKAIKDWDDLAKPGFQVIVPNPKTSGNGRYTYLAAWGYALGKTRSETEARAFVTRLFANVPVLEGGGRGATTTFTQRDVGDALVTFENEAIAIAAELGAGKFDVVYPSLSIEVAPPVAIVDRVVDQRGSRKLATAYLAFLFSPQAQEIIASHAFRPRDENVLQKFAGRFPAIKTFSVEATLGSWAEVEAKHFAEGAIYDQIVVNR
ncbi:MAG: sulfate ABC transporter substrate-binding protein [Hyphomicrobiaceae bacterium]|nr:sulfate ABC transporter substrate-binding protein [Hyphomicrobiaceae bacterium]